MQSYHLHGVLWRGPKVASLASSCRTTIGGQIALSHLLKLAKGNAMNPTMTPEEAADRLAIRELIDTYGPLRDRRDANGQLLLSEDTAFTFS